MHAGGWGTVMVHGNGHHGTWLLGLVAVATLDEGGFDERGGVYGLPYNINVEICNTGRNDFE